MTIGDPEDLKKQIEKNGFVTAQEPAVGSGSMVIAFAEAMLNAGLNYQKHLHVTAIDVDAKCAHMAYLQFSLLHIPATVLHGNTLSMELYSHWYTPAHIWGGWGTKLKQRSATRQARQMAAAPEINPTANEATTKETPATPLRQLKLF